LYICLQSQSNLKFKLPKFDLMSKFLAFSILFILLIVPVHTFGQDTAQTSVETGHEHDSISSKTKTERLMPFRKGRVLLGASVYISSDGVRYDTTSYSNQRVINDFNFEFKSGYFVLDKFLVGGFFRIKRLSSSDFVDKEIETLQVGPFLRYYLSPNSHGGVFLHMAFSYAKVRDELKFTIGNNQVDRIVDGDGFGTGLGVGYSYSPFDRMSLDMSVSYSLIFGRASITNNLAQQSVFEDFIYTQILFGLGVYVIL